jgi:hypothetical protein
MGLSSSGPEETVGCWERGLRKIILIAVIDKEVQFLKKNSFSRN